MNEKKNLDVTEFQISSLYEERMLQVNGGYDSHQIDKNGRKKKDNDSSTRNNKGGENSFPAIR